MELITENKEEELLNALENAKESLLVVTPFVTIDGIKPFLLIKKEKDIEITFITREPGVDWVTGATEYEAISKLSAEGCKVLVLEYLQSNLFLFDNKTLYVGDYFAAKNGFGLPINEDQGILTKSQIDEQQAKRLQHYYTDNPQIKSISSYRGAEKNLTKLREKYDDLGKVIEDITFSFLKPQEQNLIENSFLKRLSEERIINQYQVFEVDDLKDTYLIDAKYVIKLLEPDEGNKDHAIFTFTNEIAKKISSREIHGLVLFLDSDREYICLPGPFIKDKVMKKSYQTVTSNWQLQIYREDKELILFLVNGPKNFCKLPIGQYEGGLHFRLKGIKL
ncbi:hypothetical protein [Aquibacillus salsiterrae]|uniref:Uncharacterized protein n=1 Tax=Aquibacillus salsiterrae TaxID=2950439 RepID=A0A9X3WKG3_9BACI|nr:hypothetical protein [Aquibacillus salsiterrae]MDC3418741.1 hypothetical protein [Aquibacillus salsiterrae]